MIISPCETPDYTNSKLNFHCRRTVRSALADERRSQRIQRNDAHSITPFDGGFGHPEDHAGLFTLRDGYATGALDKAQTGRAVFTHSRHQDAHRSIAELRGHG